MNHRAFSYPCSNRGRRHDYWVSIPVASELSFVVVNRIAYGPLELAVTVNCSTIALFLAPAAAKISKLVNTCVPLMVTLNTRAPAVDQKVSAKCSRTVWLDPGVKPGMVYVKLAMRAVWYTSIGAGFVTPLKSMVLAFLMVAPPAKSLSATTGLTAAPPGLIGTGP